MLSIERGTFGYQTRRGVKTVVKDLTMSVEKGQLVCLLGANGAGKTTIFRTVLGVLPLLGGEITVDGVPAGQMSRAALAGKLAYVPQQHTPPFPYTVRQVVEMGRCVHVGTFSSPTPRDTEIARTVLERLGIGALEEKTYTHLSGGERQMVLIARALAQESDYLLLDEPTSNLDYGNQARILKCIRDLADGGRGVCLILHNPEHALMLGGDAVVLLGEDEALRGKTVELLTPGLLRRLYGVKAEMKQWTAADGTNVRSIYTGM